MKSTIFIPTEKVKIKAKVKRMLADTYSEPSSQGGRQETGAARQQFLPRRSVTNG